METFLDMRKDKMNCESIKNTICKWIKDRLLEPGCNGVVVGVSGGVD